MGLNAKAVSRLTTKAFSIPHPSVRSIALLSEDLHHKDTKATKFRIPRATVAPRDEIQAS